MFSESLSGLADNCVLQLTAGGRREVEELAKRRSNPVLRAAAARDGILRWLCEQPNRRAQSISPVVGAIRHEHVPLARNELDQAVNDLADRSLITGTKAWGAGVFAHLQLTQNGVDCVEQYDASMAGYLRAHHGQVGPVSHHTTTFNAAVSGNVAVDSAGPVSQTTIAGSDSAELVRLLQAVLESKDALSLTEASVADLTRAVEVAPTSGSQPELQRSVLLRIRGALADTAVSPTGLIFTAAVKDLADRLGIPLG